MEEIIKLNNYQVEFDHSEKVIYINQVPGCMSTGTTAAEVNEYIHDRKCLGYCVVR